MNPAHLHLMLNHVPVLAIPFGLAVLGWAMFRRRPEFARLALIVFVFSALATIPTYLTGEPAEDAIEGVAGAIEPWVEPHGRSRARLAHPRRGARRPCDRGALECAPRRLSVSSDIDDQSCPRARDGRLSGVYGESRRTHSPHRDPQRRTRPRRRWQWRGPWSAMSGKSHLGLHPLQVGRRWPD